MCLNLINGLPKKKSLNKIIISKRNTIRKRDILRSQYQVQHLILIGRFIDESLLPILCDSYTRKKLSYFEWTDFNDYNS